MDGKTTVASEEVDRIRRHGDAGAMYSRRPFLACIAPPTGECGLSPELLKTRAASEEKLSIQTTE
jgi:hypothetical protein